MSVLCSISLLQILQEFPFCLTQSNSKRRYNSPWHFRDLAAHGLPDLLLSFRPSVCHSTPAMLASLPFSDSSGVLTPQGLCTSSSFLLTWNTYFLWASSCVTPSPSSVSCPYHLLMEKFFSQSNTATLPESLYPTSLLFSCFIFFSSALTSTHKLC